MKKLVLLIPLFLVVWQLKAQTVTITGKVIDAVTKEPLMAISVVVEETKATTMTDAAGQYRIVANVGQTLRISSVGYAVKTIKVAPGGNRIDVELQEDMASLKEVVITGYGSQRKADLTGAVAVVDVAKSKDVPSGNVMQTIQGKVAGVYITTNGNPNGASTVTIRGTTSLNNASPLYVIDGVPTTDPNVIQGIDQNTIESFQVLKDASSASIYGSRATGGVIIVTTKSGKAGGSSITFNSSITAQENLRLLDMMNTQQYGRALWQASVNDRTNPAAQAALYTFDWNGDFNNPILNSVTPTQTIGGDPNLVAGDTDWQKQVFKRGFITTNSLTATAGSEKGNLLVGLTYYKNDGLVINNNFKRYSARLNTSANFFNNKLKIGENFQFNNTRETPVPNDLGGVSVIALGTQILPILPVRKTDGSFAGPLGAGFSDRNNPVHISNINKDDTNRNFGAFGNFFAEANLIKNLVFKSTLGLDYSENYNTNIERAFQTGSLGRPINSLSVNQGHILNWTFSNTLNYNLEREKSRTSVLVGMEAIKSETALLGATRQGFAIETTDYYVIDAGTGIATNSGSRTGNQLLSYFAKVNYALQDKYLTSLTVRYDGSSRFGGNNQFGLFPAASFGWVISKEKFFEKATNVVSDLKLRIGAGQTGSQSSILDIARFQLFSTNYGYTGNTISGSAYDINGVGTGNLPSGYVATRSANPNLKWETTSELNMGADFGFFNQKVTGSFDYFMRKTKDILISPTIAGVVGEGSARTLNAATVTNRGYEIGLGFADRKGDFSYSINTNVTHSRDRVIYVPTSVLSTFGGNTEKNILGRSRTSVFGYLTDGIFQNADEVAASAAKPGKGVGRIRYKDLNNDGVINVFDQDWIGNTLPSIEYGINASVSYKNFGLVIGMRGLQGVMVTDASKNITDFFGLTAGVNRGTRLLNAWNPNNIGSTIPAMSLANSNAENTASDYNRVNGSFFKVQSTQLNYTISSKALQKVSMQSLRLFLIGENFLLLSNRQFTGPDPETPGDIYPRPVRLTFGIDARF